MDIIKVFYDTETTGVNHKIHSIHQLSGVIEINEDVVETFDFKVRPHTKAKYEISALRVCRVTEAELKAYPDMKQGLKEFKALMGKYIDPFNTTQKAYLVGYNNRAFDDLFLRMWFELCGDEMIGAWFWNNTLDALILATEYLIGRREVLPSFKLFRVAIELGIVVDKNRIHEAGYDVYLTREIYRIVTGREIEI